MGQPIFDRLNAELEQERTGRMEGPQKEALDALGREIRQWRLRQGYTRRFLASKLHMPVNQLICIENRLAQADDVSAKQLLILQTLLTGYNTHPLTLAIKRYLGALEP
jgi:hypothetical protein